MWFEELPETMERREAAAMIVARRMQLAAGASAAGALAGASEVLRRGLPAGMVVPLTLGAVLALVFFRLASSPPRGVVETTALALERGRIKSRRLTAGAIALLSAAAFGFAVVAGRAWIQ
jgi:hypothetical protein